MRRLGLRGQFFAISLPITGVIVVAALLLSFRALRDRTATETLSRANLLRRVLAESSAINLACQYDANAEGAQDELTGLKWTDPAVEYMAVVDRSGKVLAFQPGDAFRGDADALRLEKERDALASTIVRQHDQAVQTRWRVVQRTQEELYQSVELDRQNALLGEPSDTVPERVRIGRVLVSLDGTRALQESFLPIAVVCVVFPVLVFSVLAWLFATLFRRITRMVEFADAAATGDLAGRMSVSGSDELSTLARALNQMTQNLSSVLARMARVGAELGLVIELITESATGLSRGSERQWSSLDQTRTELDEMARSLRETARNVEAISGWATESASDAKAIGERNTEVNRDIERLSGAISSMMASVEQVGENISALARHVDVLTHAASDTESAIARTEQALQSVRLFADSSSSIAERVATEAKSGAVSVAGSLTSINRLEATMADVRTATSGLTDRLGLVAVLLQAIVDVARRTNLLSLNAAIIASQAGEHGRQFQVVAEEVKALSAQTAGLTRDIERVLEEIAGASEAARSTVAGATEVVAEGVSQAHRAGSVLDSILEAAAQSAQMSQEIAESIAEREGDLRRINQAMERVVSVTSDIRSVTRTQVHAAGLMREAATTMSEVSEAVGRSTDQQMEGSARISRALADVSESVARLSSTQSEQARGGDRILGSVEEVRSLASRSRGEARTVEETLVVLVNQTGELRAELDRFVLDPEALSVNETQRG